MQNIYLRVDPVTGYETFQPVNAPAVFGMFAEGVTLTGKTGDLTDAFPHTAPVDSDISDAEMFARDLQFHGESGDGWQDEDEDSDAHDSGMYTPEYDD